MEKDALAEEKEQETAAVDKRPHSVSILVPFLKYIVIGVNSWEKGY